MTTDAQDMIRARNLLGMTQTELAERLGWTSGHQVSVIERGRKPLQQQTRLAVERVLIAEGCWESYALGFGLMINDQA